MAASGELFIYSIAGFIAGIALFAKGILWFRMKRLIENTPTSKVRSIAMGLVEVFGKVLPAQGKVLKSPFSGKDCVYYKYTIEQYQKTGKHSSSWVTVRKGDEGVPFHLKDETGSVLVDPTGANVDIPMDFELQSGIGKDPPPIVMGFLKKISYKHDGFLFNKPVRYREYFLATNDSVYIMGTAGDNPFVGEAAAKASAEDVMIQKGGGNIYYISDKGEKEILGGLRNKSLLGVFGGAVLSAGCLLIIFISLGLI